MTYNKTNAGSLGIRYFISSETLSAEAFGKLCRGHWGVESMHWWLDSVIKEDNVSACCREFIEDPADVYELHKIDEFKRNVKETATEMCT